MKGQVTWVRNGVLDISPTQAASPAAMGDDIAFESGDVRVVSGSLGTEIKWKVNTPCFSSLLRVVHLFHSSKPPYILRFHAVGWFEEVYREPWNAIRRIEEILARGDRHFTSRIFVMERDPEGSELPAVIRESFRSNQPVEDYAVECAIEDLSQSFVVDKIGPKSIIGRVWGTVTSTFPCQSRSKFGDVVSEAYEKVLRDGKPHYDQVIAALRFPDNQVHWLPYHRAIFPNHRPGGSQSVIVVAEVAKVDIKVL